MSNTTAVPDLPAPDQNALNDAAWKFIDNATGEMSAPLWNTLKVPLWAAIRHYIAATQPAPSGDAVEVLREALAKIECQPPYEVGTNKVAYKTGHYDAIQACLAVINTTSRAATVAKDGGEDADRLLHISRKGINQHAYAAHVLRRGGDGGLSDIRSYLDAVIEAGKRATE